MDYASKLKRFMKFICRKYEADGTFRSYGEASWPLIRESGIDLGDARAQLAAMDILLGQDLIEAVDLRGVKREGVKHVRPSTKIRPTLHGLESRQQDWPKIVSAVAEGITRGVIKGFMKK